MTGSLLRTMVATDKIHGGDYRADIGDMAPLVTSIKDVGMLNPLIVTPSLLLLAGQRRLVAYREMGWTMVPVTEVDDITEALRLIRLEGDICRLPMTLFDQVRLGFNLETLGVPRAVQHSGAPITIVRELLAQEFGISGAHYHRGRVIVQGSRSDDPAVRQVAEVAMVDVLVAGSGVRRGYNLVCAARDGRSLPSQPAAVSRSTPRHTKRLAKMTELADSGASASQIAESLGLSRHRVIVVAKENGITLPGEQSIHKTLHVNSNRVLREMVHTLEGLIAAIALIDMASVDPMELPEWTASLSGSIRTLTGLFGQMKEQMKRGQEREDLL